MAFIDNCFTAMVFRNLYQAYLLKVGLMQILAYHAPLSTSYHVTLYVNFLSTNFSCGR